MSKIITPESELAKYVDCYASERYGRFINESKEKKFMCPPEIEMIEGGNSYLDVSCGRGRSLELARKLGKNIDARGTEMVPALCGPKVQLARLPELENVAPAQFVSCYEVLEHLPTHDVLPAIERLVSLAEKMLTLSTNDLPSARKWKETRIDPLHLSRFPLHWWLVTLEGYAKAHNGKLYYRDLRPNIATQHRWVFRLDFREPYTPFEFHKVDYKGYEDPKQPFWFWYNPTFPVSELKEMPESRQFDLPKVKELHKDLDARGILNPLLVHNMPGQPNRRYWTRTGNHRRNWALLRGIQTVPAIIYGGCEFEPCKPLSLQGAQRLIRDGKITFAANQAPDVVDVRDWSNGGFTWL